MSELPKLIPLSEFHTLGEREKMFLEVFSIGGLSTIQDDVPRTMNLADHEAIVASLVIASTSSQFYKDLAPKNQFVPTGNEDTRNLLSKMFAILGEHHGWQQSINGAVAVLAGLDGERAPLQYHESEGVVGVFGTIYGFYVVRAGHPLGADPDALDLPSTPMTKH